MFNTKRIGRLEDRVNTIEKVLLEKLLLELKDKLDVAFPDTKVEKKPLKNKKK